MSKASDIGGVLSDKYTVPPFSILDATKKNWQERKQGWMALGIQSELGRGENLLNFSKTVLAQGGGTSVFDPVLCKLAYKWFAKPHGQVIDPFAGGSVRGIVAGCSDLKYWGCDLSKPQVEENRKQAAKIASKHRGAIRQMPVWVVGDSRQMLDEAPEADFVFSCPPYGDLEVYSDEPNDLSAMSRTDFLRAYKAIIAKAVAKMRNDSFACFVVADYRAKNGRLHSLVCPTIQAFETAGAYFYNSAILRTSPGNAGIRTERIFGSNRKLVGVHQNVLVFCKGDWEKAAAKNKGLTPE